MLLLLTVFPPRSFRHSCAFDFSGYEAEFNSELSSSSDERERESSHLLSDRLRGGVKGGVYDTLRLVRSLSSLPDITVISHHRRMNTEKVRVREGSRARPQTPVVRSVSSQQPEDYIRAQGEIEIEIVYYCLVIF